MNRKKHTWHMKIKCRETIYRILNGTKKIEFRIGKEKWQDMQIGDLVVFTYTPKHGNPITVRVEVADILKYDSFEELLDEYDPMEYAGREREELLDRLIKKNPKDETRCYTREEVAEYKTFNILMRNPERIQ